MPYRKNPSNKHSRPPINPQKDAKSDKPKEETGNHDTVSPEHGDKFLRNWRDDRRETDEEDGSDADGDSMEGETE